MNSFRGKVALCITVTAFAGIGAYHLWISRKKRAKAKKTDDAADLISIFDLANVYIKDPETVMEKIRILLEGGPESLQVISDFDMTLTRYLVDGKRGDTSHGSIEKASCMSETFRVQASATKNKYYPLEHSIVHTFEEKAKIMTEWWETIHKLMIDDGFQRRWIPGVVSECTIVLRDGSDVFFQILDEANVPLYVVSAGIGDIIEEAIQKQSRLRDNARIIANLMEFDEEGKLSGFKGDLIHSYNKHEVLDHIRGFVRHTKSRHNLILFGDTLGDPSMADGMVHVTNELKIGFLNYKPDELLEAYQDAYDVVLVEEESWDLINEFLACLLKQRL
ncbi:7-methylguanosine phosphate-specific 5'-nucleotidase A-like [Rhopilema esculentum]|uniref:7-methylguanosine phosphate-specific 5'-nucleotidase A-like n=1 Tax=Rhopilema esculentum TaxID=499914 RepID=UPI0031DB8B7F